MPTQEDDIAIFTSPSDYAYHINEVVSVGTDSLRVLRRKFSMSTPYGIERINIADCSRLTYRSTLSLVRIVFGVLLVALILAIFYFLAYYWASFDSGQTFRVGLLALGLVYGLRWAFMSRSHLTRRLGAQENHRLFSLFGGQRFCVHGFSFKVVALSCNSNCDNQVVPASTSCRMCSSSRNDSATK